MIFIEKKKPSTVGAELGLISKGKGTALGRPGLTTTLMLGCTCILWFLVAGVKKFPLL